MTNSKSSFSTFTRNDNSLIIVLNYFLPFIIVISIFVTIGIIAGIFFDFWHLFNELSRNPAVDISEYVLKIIELLFLSSIPLLITVSFYKYYKKVLKSVFIQSPGSNEQLIVETMKSSIDLSITKYNFYSILISTGFIILFRKVNNLKFSISERELYLYGLMVFALLFLLYFILQLKHSILEGSSKILDKVSFVNHQDEIKQREQLKERINSEIKELNELKSTAEQECLKAQEQLAVFEEKLLKLEKEIEKEKKKSTSEKK